MKNKQIDDIMSMFDGTSRWSPEARQSYQEHSSVLKGDASYAVPPPKLGYCMMQLMQ